MPIQKNKNIWRSGLTKEEKCKAKKELREFLARLKMANRA